MIGCGAVCEVKSAPAYQQTEGFALAAVTARNSERVADYARRHGIARCIASAEALIADSDIDAIYIATPPDSHRHYALQVAASGKPCCIEKPLAPSFSDSRDIVEAFATTDTPLFVAYYRRSLPRFQQLKQWLAEGAIGEPRHVSWRLSKPANDIDLRGEYNWRTDKGIAAGGYFDDLASHGLDLLNYLLGEVVEAQGICRNQQGLYSAFDAITANWAYRSGVTASGSWNFGCQRRADRVELLGSRGTIRFSVFDEAPVELDNEQGLQRLAIANPDTIQLQHVDNIRRHLSGEAEHPSGGSSAAHTSWLMDKILGRL